MSSVAGSSYLLMQDKSFKPALPVPIKVGDLNLDGFPDLLPIVVSGDGSRTPKMLLSKHGHGFELVKDDVEVLESITDARSIAMVDLDEDVRALTFYMLAVI